jgi:hypothetical protein
MEGWGAAQEQAREAKQALQDAFAELLDPDN